MEYRKPIAAELKAIHRATDTDVARRALEDFDAGVRGRKYPAIAQCWRRNWENVIPFFAFPVAVRRIIYTTNGIESLNAKLRHAVRTRDHFPTDEAAIKWLHLVLRQVAQTWKMRRANCARRRPDSPSCSTADSSSVMAKPAPHSRFLTVPIAALETTKEERPRKLPHILPVERITEPAPCASGKCGSLRLCKLSRRCGIADSTRSGRIIPLPVKAEARSWPS
jgi:hypothetical protein